MSLLSAYVRNIAGSKEIYTTINKSDLKVHQQFISITILLDFNWLRCRDQ